jgi:mannitol/fructose-specific phosphotransferase system IIA component (Ntr-type)
MGKTHLFFLLALRNDALHLRWLSRLAWIVRHPGRLSRLMEATDGTAMHEVLLDAANNLPASLKPTGQVAGR